MERKEDVTLHIFFSFWGYDLYNVKALYIKKEEIHFEFPLFWGG